jgi:apolipoprotein N-acyltransferase
LLNIHNNEKSIYIKIISPNLDLKFNLENEDIRKNINKLIKYSDPDSKTKTLFVWPEGVFSGLEFNQINEYKNLFKKAFSKNHLLLFGINTLSTPERNYDLFNSLIVVNNNLEIKYQYNKQKLVPFGEFLPIEKLLSKIGLKKITEGHGSFLKGNKQKNFMFDKIEFLPLICYEIIFPKLSQISKTKNAIINISEDAWFGDSIGPYQHFSKAIFRAIENNVFLIRSANKGISAFIDNKGVVKKSLGPSETGAIEYKVPIINNNFLNYKIDLIFFVLLITYVLIFILLRKKTK